MSWKIKIEDSSDDCPYLDEDACMRIGVVGGICSEGNCPYRNPSGKKPEKKNVCQICLLPNTSTDDDNICPACSRGQYRNGKYWGTMKTEIIQMNAKKESV
jgi:hypothetical protein